MFNSFRVSSNFCPLLNDGPDLDPSIVFLKEFFEKVNFEKSQQTTTKA